MLTLLLSSACVRSPQIEQRKAAEIFGGCINPFSRHENDKTKPPLALVKFFKLLDRHPALLGEVRAACLTR